MRVIHALVEGHLDGRLLTTLLRQLGLGERQVVLRDAGGHNNFWKSAARYNEAGRRVTVIGLGDLEQAPCASHQLATLKGGRSDGFKLRLAVRMIESWIVADRVAFASFVGVPVSRIPVEPDLEIQPKRLVAALAKQSSKRAIREGLAPQYASALVGPEFTTLMARFVEAGWSAQRARQNSPSLDRACTRWADL